MLIQYAVHEINDLDSETDRYELQINTFDQKWAYLAAQECANNYHNCHDGWENDWPLIIRLFVDNEIIGDFIVEMEHIPSFSAKKLENR